MDGAIRVELGERVAAGGDIIGRLEDGRIVLVEGALPGEVVRAELTEERRDFARASVVAIERPHPGRVAPPCPYVDRGGAPCPDASGGGPPSRDMDWGGGPPALMGSAVELRAITPAAADASSSTPGPGCSGA